MKEIKNIKGKIYFTCAACMTVWADALSWANKHKRRITKDPKEAENIIVLSCQVTDLAILNDLKTMERLQITYKNKQYFISGCLAERKDIKLPKGVQRLKIPKEDYQELNDRSLVHFEKPFWIKRFKEEDSEFKQGHLFRKMYPLRIGKGCPFNCEYCTIRITRGRFKEYKNHKQLEKEFLKFKDVILIADSPMPNQIKHWCSIALKYKKTISIRNIEPTVSVQCKNEIINLAKKGFLKIFHSPIQSNNKKVLQEMKRDVKSTFETIKMAKRLKKLGVFIATNIIIDYKNFKQDFSKVLNLYDYVSWNPYWDGKWDRNKAEKRFKKYINNNKIKLQ